MKQTTTGTAERFGLLLLTFFASLAACGQALLLLHLRLNRLPLLLAGVVMLLVARKLSRTPLFDLAALTAGLLALGMVCGQIYDLSWDGQTYHQEAVYQLAHGWNPVWDAPLPMWHRDIEWINCYPKGNWIIGAILYLSGKQIESAKLLSPALMVTAVLLGYAACRALSLKRGMSGLLALLAALCPVAVCQLGSFYVDGSLGSLLTLLLSLAVLYVKQPRGRYLLAMIAAMGMLCVVKFTGVVYACVYAFCLLLFVLLRLRTRLRAVLLTQTLGIVFGVLFLGFQPYVTNLLSGRHPFHPLHGKLAAELMSDQLGPAFTAQPRLLTLTESLFSQSSNDRQWPRWKIPFSVTKQELKEFVIPDARIGGFGPWFGGTLILSVFAMVALTMTQLRNPKPPTSRREKRQVTSESLRIGCYVLLGLVGSCLINPAAWWARYVPQLWLVPVIVLLLLRIHHSRFVWPLLIALLGNQVLVIVPSLIERIEEQKLTRAQLRALQAHPIDVRFHSFYGTRFRLWSGRVNYRVTSALHCAEHQFFVRSAAEFCEQTQEPAAP